jgi:hypothetical protein
MYDLAPIIVGWSDPEGTRPHLGALLLGYYTDDGKLIYAGRVGTGMPVALRSAIRKMMKIAATAAFEAIIVIGALKDNGRRDYTLNSTTLGPTNGVQFAHVRPANRVVYGWTTSQANFGRVITRAASRRRQHAPWLRGPP